MYIPHMNPGWYIRFMQGIQYISLCGWVLGWVLEYAVFFLIFFNQAINQSFRGPGNIYKHFRNQYSEAQQWPFLKTLSCSFTTTYFHICGSSHTDTYIILNLSHLKNLTYAQCYQYMFKHIHPIYIYTLQICWIHVCIYIYIYIWMYTERIYIHPSMCIYIHIYM